MDTPSPLITAADIAHDLGVNIHTVRRWFRTGIITGRPLSRLGWTTSRTHYNQWKNTHPDLTRYDLDAETIAHECRVPPHVVRTWFTTHGAPGTKIRHPGERAARWRTTRAQFTPWLHQYLTRTGEQPPPSPPPADTLTGATP